MSSRMWHASVLRQITVAALACVAAATWLGARPLPLAGAERPNIVVFYLDDAAPHDGRLWNDPARTPAIYNTFVAHGTHFRQAFGEDPMCCPGRASLLTGLHSHNNGVMTNDARLFGPQETVAGALQDAGYTTMWIGKYMNLNNKLSSAGWAAHMAPWTVFDGMFGANGAFYNYKVRTKDTGDSSYRGVHSTQMVADRSVMRIGGAPANKPIFAVLSVFNIHAPNIPMPVDEELLEKCDDMPPWWTPAYNEADVSDKPAYIQALPLLPDPDGWPMDAYCREMFGVDRLVERVTDELEAVGRLDNTLLVFTADNGMAWGAHRREFKNVPYATAVPLYMAWPGGWGNAPRVVDDYVSNIDLAPTFCALGGCALGPYPSGQSAPDGLSLVDLLDNGSPLGRDALLESALFQDPTRDVPPWAAVRTTPQSGLGMWHYVEYADGERELYDLASDPYELDNLAGDPGHAAIAASLAQRLGELLDEGRVNRPDLSIWSMTDNAYAGYNLFASTPSPAQTLTVSVVRRRTYTFRIDLANHKVSTDSFTVTAAVTGGHVRLTWLLDGVDVTGQMSSGGVRFESLASMSSGSLTLQVKIKRRFPRGRTTIDLVARPVSSPAQDDHVTLVVRR